MCLLSSASASPVPRYRSAISVPVRASWKMKTLEAAGAPGGFAGCLPLGAMQEQRQEQQRQSMRTAARGTVAAACRSAAAAANSGNVSHFDTDSGSTWDDHGVDDEIPSDSNKATEADQHSRNKDGGSIAGAPAMSLQSHQRERRSKHSGASRTGSKRHTDSSSSSGAAMPAAVDRGRLRLAVTELPEGGWRVNGLVRDCCWAGRQCPTPSVCILCVQYGNSAAHIM
jgi:hypothetical protein